MRIAFASSLLLSVLIASLHNNNGIVVDARKPSRPSSAASAGRPTRRGGSGGGRPPAGPSSTSRRRQYEEEEEDYEEEDAFGFPDEEEEEDYDEEEEEEDDYYEEEEEDYYPQKKQRGGPPPSKKRGAPPPPPQPKKRGGSSKSRPSPRRYDDYEEDDYDDYAAPRRGGNRSRGGRGPAPRGRGRPTPRGGPRDRRNNNNNVVPYVNRASSAASSTFTRGLSAIREHIPDASTVRDAATSSLSAVKDKSSKLSTNIYREIKGLTSSELEQVMLKATRPDDQPVKGKHVERLVGVTYQISGRYDIYDAVLRKLWNKMAEKDWRTTVKALYILHRFSSDGGPDHQAALKARLRELRRTRDPKRKEKYFNSKQLLEGDASPENQKYRAFMARYAHYVLLRAQCFGGMFTEIADTPSSSSKKPSAAASAKASQKPITSTSLRSEHLEASQMLLKAGCACMLKDGEECENTALAVERVASDLIGLNTAVAVALNRALRGRESKGADLTLIKRWCEFYSEELLPQTKSMVKRTSAKLDAYGLFLPSRMGASVSPELLKKGLQGAGEEEEKGAAVSEEKEKGGAAAKSAEKEAAKMEPEEEEVEEEEDEEEEEEEEEEEADIGGGMDMFGGDEGGDGY
mmetsp:Transcript_5861/g.8035  ORF Transcript_5861/g.8035 Transcript_5861/m.8035 type:complete len:631 (-) Transcript_5861:53-1945(-)